ncbi:MAG TPA: hypothetical protein VD837_16975 [Terriglobales bacterium]|nr:hypothetical protein [Terriglobales bacterium]
MITHWKLIAVLLLIVVAQLTWAQRVRDPLNSKETNELREAKQDPPKRLKLYTQYARARMQAIEHLRSDPRFAADRGPEMHDLIQDLGTIVDEMDDNIDMYAEARWDIRKPLKEIIQTDTELQLKLRQLKESATGDPALAEEVQKHYRFVLDDTIESVNSSLDIARKTLEDQEAAAKKKELRKPE